VTISVGGGIEPAWGPTGDELYYRREGELMVVPLQRAATSLSVGTPRRVMPDDFLRQTAGGAGGMANYDVAPDGRSFVMVEELGRDDVEPGRLYVVFGWHEQLKARVPN